MLVVISAPSGGGKTTICKKLIERHPDEMKISVSATTRRPRPGEVNGVDYFFISEPEFFERVRRGEFLEYERVHGNYYGTLRSTVEKLLAEGYTVLFDVDVNGALAIKKRFPEAVLIFIKPPSIEALKERLRARQTDDPEEIEKRLRRLPEEYAKSKEFDYIVVNNKLEDTLRQIESIIARHAEER
ncbi:MAG: guanylate kinase [Calditrichaeota bacterium]|nr:MAG: guanylate kinase [Calditrichota bacterium]